MTLHAWYFEKLMQFWRVLPFNRMQEHNFIFQKSSTRHGCACNTLEMIHPPRHTSDSQIAFDSSIGLGIGLYRRLLRLARTLLTSDLTPAFILFCSPPTPATTGYLEIHPFDFQPLHFFLGISLSDQPGQRSAADLRLVLNSSA